MAWLLVALVALVALVDWDCVPMISIRTTFCGSLVGRCRSDGRTDGVRELGAILFSVVMNGFYTPKSYLVLSLCQTIRSPQMFFLSFNIPPLPLLLVGPFR